MQKIKTIRRVDLEKNASQTNGQTDGQPNRTNFIRPLPQRWRFDDVLPKFENKSFLNYLA